MGSCPTVPLWLGQGVVVDWGGRVIIYKRVSKQLGAVQREQRAEATYHSRDSHWDVRGNEVVGKEPADSLTT